MRIVRGRARRCGLRRSGRPGYGGGLRGAPVGLVALVTLVVVAAAGPVAAGCSSSGQAAGRQLTVSAAYSLRGPFTELAGRFEAEQGLPVKLNLAPSGVLERQIEGGAPADVFASAAPRQMEALVKKGLMDEATVADFAGNRIALLVRVDSPLGLRDFADLSGANVHRITTGNPEVVPFGEYSLEVLKGLGLWNAVADKLIYAENAGQALSYLASGEVDAALMFASEAVGQNGVRLVAVAPSETHSPIRYPIGVVAASREPEAAKAFVQLVRSAQGQAVLQRYGFTAAPTP